ncbi:MAG: PKD domain-containing protein, partial [Bacteroidota bacterium]
MMMKKVTRTGLLTLLSILWAQAGFATPNADFTSATVSGCVPLNIRFDNLSTGAGPLTYQWIFNPGNIVSNYVNPVMTFNRPGSYTVTLIARESNGQSDTLTISNFITVHDTPVAAFTGNGSLAQCLDGNIFHFDNQQQPGETYLWDFNDGTTSTIADPDHTFTQAGQYNITLLTTNGFGCTDQITRPAYVTVFPEPDATVNANTTFSCNTNTVFQFNTSTNGITSYRWNFGDGRSSTSASPSHQYTSPGSYNVSVILTSDHGCIDTTEVPLNIRIGAGYYVSIGVDEDSVCMGQPITFRNPNYNIAACTWNLGDGTTSGNVIPPPHVYANPGTYQVQLLITDSTGCQFSATRQVTVFPKPQVSFNISNQMGCAPFRVTFGNLTTGYDSCQWLFGDGGTSFDRSATVNYTYYAAGTFSVTLKCWNSNGCSETIVLRDTIRVSNLQAGFISDVRMGCPPMQVQFTSVSQGNNMSYNWNFGNGTNSTQANPSVSFPNAGTYPVTLVVSDGICMDTTFRNNYIQTLDPTANYIAPDTTVGCAPLTTQFTDATLGAISWRWDFGDGTSSNQQNPYHTYTRPGLYSVSLQTISAGGSCVKTIDNFRTFHVLGGWAGFDHEITSICPPYSAQFTDTSNNAVSWLWDFGDGTTDTSRNPSHVFTVGGYHSVRLTITTADGCTYSTMQTNGIYFPPFGANFYAITSGNTLPVDVQFFANSAGATGWFWDFADGRTSTLENPLVHFNAQPSGSITLTIVSDLCTLTYSTPLINFGIPDTTPVDLGNPGAPENQIGCSPLSV